MEMDFVRATALNVYDLLILSQELTTANSSNTKHKRTSWKTEPKVSEVAQSCLKQQHQPGYSADKGNA
jgi:hypothetical protein